MSETPAPSYFVAGGTVPSGSPSYVERLADRELYEALLGGEFCYVLNSRQMGKSSLAVRTIARLQEAGIRTAFVDLTRIGGATVTPDQWYAGVLLETGRALGLRNEAAAWLKDHREVGPAQRLLSFLQEGALVRIESPVVLMFDEIDAVRSLGFSTDEFFAGLRQLHNGRASDPALRRLTVCLLGAALPSDLIRDPRTTPFNVGRRIELRDFTPEEARPFASQVGEAALARVLHWTGGHPFLTQALCAELSTPHPRPLSPGGERGAVDTLVQSRYLDARARETDTNLTDVGRRLFGEGDPNVTDEDRATTFALYDRMLRGKGVPDDEANPAAARIKMSGVARVESGELRPRNRIYQSAFDAKWVRNNTPGQELRRQRRAFWRGALRTGGIAAAVVALVSHLAYSNYSLASEARMQRDQARYAAYVASIRTLPLAYEEGNLYEIDRTLEAIKDNSARGWEWDYWHHAANPGQFTIPAGQFRFDKFSKDGNFLYGMSWRGDEIKVIDLQSHRIVRAIRLNLSQASGTTMYLTSGDRRLAVLAPRGLVLLVDLASGREVARRRFDGLSFGTAPTLDDGHLVAFRGNEILKLNAETLELKSVKTLPPGYRVELNVGPSGRWLAWTELSRNQSGNLQIVVARATDAAEVDRFDIPYGTFGSRFSPDGRLVAVSGGQGNVIFRDFTQRKSRVVTLSKDLVNGITFSPDGQKLLAIFGGRKALLWDLAAERAVRSFPDAYTAGFTPSGREIYTQYWNLRLYDADAASDPAVYRPSKPWVTASISYAGDFIHWAPDENSIVDLMHPGSKPVVERTTTKMFGLTPSKKGWMRLSGDRTKVEFGHVGSADPDLRLPMPSNEANFAFALSGDGRFATMQGRVYALPDRRPTPLPVATLPNEGLPSFAAFSSNGEWLLSSDASGISFLWRVGEWQKPLWAYRAASPAATRTAAYSPDWKQIALSTNLDDVVVLDRTTGRQRFRLIGHSQWINDLTWSPDGRRIATGSDDGTVRLWDARTGKQLCIVGRHDGGVTAVRFLPGGRTLASLGSDMALRLWMTEDRR